MSSLKSRLVVASAALVAIIAAALPASAAIGNAYTMHPLVSDVVGAAAQQDSNVVNAWGLVSGPQSFPTPWWIANNGSDTSTLYNAATNTIPSLVVSVDSAPTGIVFHNAFSDPTNFVLPTGGSALFIFATETGVIRGWNSGAGTTAQLGVDRSGVDAVYKGLAIAQTASGARLYATDFHNKRVDVFDGSWGLVRIPASSTPASHMTTDRSGSRPSARGSS